MLYTRNAFHFRKFYKEDVARENGHIDLNFVGSLHPDKKRRETGFSKLIYGNREDLGKLLGTIALNVAADDQAIYELIQNADDCKSSFFSVSYNEDYLLCINNGNYFSDRDMSAIINVAGNYKDGEDIGTFGIGFKILHRLVGADDGREAIINDYAGPIIFSWNKFFQLNAFLNDDEVKVGFDVKKDSENPWLVKLLYTCFPSHLDEKLKLQDYDTEGVKFSKNELSEMRTFLKQSLQNVNLKETNNLKSGSIFFLKLGKGKSKFLDDGIDKIKSGLSYSFKFLNSLQKIYINGEEIKAQVVLDYSHSFSIDSEEFKEINPKNKNRDIKFTFAYYRDYKKAVNLQNELAPNLYTFFSMDEEKNGFSFLLHCNAFDMNNDRRKLQANSQINDKLLPIIAQNIIEYSDRQKENNRNLFLSLYANFLLSKDPKNKPHIDNNFSKYIHQYISETIPTKNNNYSDNPQNVKINKTKQQLNLSDFGLNDIEWFQWDNETDNLLIDVAKSKLDIEEWSLRDVFVNADLICLNDWIKSLSEGDYNNFLEELNKEYFSKEAVERLLETDLLRFSDGNFYSINEIVGNDDFVFLSNKVINIQTELKSLGFLISDLDISSFSFYEKISSKLKSDEDLYDAISERTSTENNLTVNQKQNLFRNFINPATKFIGIGDETLKKLELFCDNQGEIKPLFQLVSSSLNTSSWLNPYKIKADEYFVQLNSYLIQEEDLFDKIILPNIEIIKDELTEAKEIKELVTIFKNKPRPFFNEYIIRKQTNGYEIIDKSDKFQIIPPKDERRNFIDFIETYLSDELIVLPYDFSDFNDQDGILKGEKLHSQILSLVDVDEHKETLVDFIHYNEPKRKFLQEISEFNFNSETTYTKEDYEFKILDLACSELKENDYPTFKDKITIETEEQDLALSQIPSSSDRVVIDNKELSQSKILPNEAKNGKVLSDLLEQFIIIGLQQEQLYKLFGIQSGNDPKQVFEILKQEYNILKNAQQLVFVLLYAKEFDENIENFKVETLDDKEWELKYNYYTKTLSFIGEDYLLKPQYSDVGKIIHLPIAICNSENQILQQPYFSENNFICPSLKSDLSEDEKLALIDFLYSEWGKDTNKQKVQNIDWSKINDTETKNILDFNPNQSVFPSKYACENEQLPDYLIKWIGKDDNRIDFISDLGVWTENSVIVELRKFLKGKSKGFHNNRLAQETRFNDDETTLFNTFEWLKENDFMLNKVEQFETFKKVVEVINDNRSNSGDLVIQDKYNFEELEENSTEWKETESFTIYLYDEEMPKTVGLDEIDEYVFYRYNEDNYAINENIIYLNSKNDKKKTLQKIASDDENDFAFEDLWALFGESSNREQELEKEIARLQQQVAKTDNATLGAEFSSDISKNDQKEANREAKELVKQRLENEGFEFTRGIGNYSTIDGVVKDDIEFPLVVKSYKYKDEPLKIGANEWIQLMKPNSMFWVNFGNGELGCLKLYELLRNQDKLTISFSTENLDVGDRLDKFAELLHYFGNVHFDFNSVMPSNIARNLGDYRFDERKTEEDLSSDDESLL